MLTVGQHCGTWDLARVGAPADAAPPIERMFRCTRFLATGRDAMVREGCGEGLGKLVAEARSFQKSLRGKASD